MDVTVSNPCRAGLPPEKTLQRHLRTLSKYMSACSVQKISNCLCRSRTLTEYEVQVIQSQATDTQKASQLVQTVIRKGRTVTVTEEDHYHLEDISNPETIGEGPPCIINIHNSLLTNCIIGNNNDFTGVLSQTHGANDKMEYTEGADQQMTEQDPTDAHSIQLESSHVEYVIIGDNNYMSIGTNQDSGQQEQSESEPEDSEGLKE